MERTEELQRKLHFVMALIGGFMGGYAILCRCDVFGNAQTANMIGIVTSLLGKDYHHLLVRIGAFLLYICGILSAVVWKKHTKCSVHYMAVTVDMLAMFILGFFPSKMDNLLGLYPIFFSMALQWSAFPGVYGYNCSTIFSTNNLKQCTMATAEYIYTKDDKMAHKAKFYGTVLICYHTGVMIAFICCKFLEVRAAWAGMVLAGIAYIMVFMEQEIKKQTCAVL